MTQARLYFSDKCPDTAPFVAGLAARGIAYEAINITDSMPNLKQFLALRDSQPAFAAKKAHGQVGIPVLATADGQFHFSLETL